MTKRKARIEHSSGGVVARRMDGNVHLLLIRDPYGNWGLPKGHVENGESSCEAALREVREETGLTHLEAGPSLGSIDWHFRLKGDLVHKFCDYFLMASPHGDTSPEVSEGITECRWLPVDEAIETVAYDNAREVVVRAADALNSDEAGSLL
ncbi:MAG: NUDIX hydrolase [Gemmatimonadota bacterium]|nr:NUDIX hydrolase [Gemmatimonadota bacterium]